MRRRRAEDLPGDADAIRCRVTALIELQRFADCAATIEKDVADDALRKDLAFERAYALYKCGKVDESLRILQTETSQDERESTRAMQLEAQLMYRAGRHDEAATIYEALFRDRADDVGESPNTAVNLAAALVAAGRGSGSRRRAQEAEDVPEGLVRAGVQLRVRAAGDRQPRRRRRLPHPGQEPGRGDVDGRGSGRRGRRG